MNANENFSSARVYTLEEYLEEVSASEGETKCTMMCGAIEAINLLNQLKQGETISL